MGKRLLVLIDFSPYSPDLLKYVADWNRKLGAEIVLLHKTYPVVPALADAETKREMGKASCETAHAQLEELAKQIVPPDQKIIYEVTDGSLNSYLLQILSQPYEYLVFVGVKGTGMLKQLLIGSVALDVIEHSSQLVVAIPKNIQLCKHAKLHVAVADKYPLNVLAFQRFLEFLNPENISITFFSICDADNSKLKQEELLKELVALFQPRFAVDYIIYDGEQPLSSIKKIIRHPHEELLVIQKGSRLLTDMLFRKFLINELVYQGETPLVVLP